MPRESKTSGTGETGAAKEERALMSAIQKVKDYIDQYKMIQRGDRVLAAVSGGADSVCLLSMLQRLQDSLSFELEAAHVEHGIRGEESLEDADFVRRLCARMGIKLYVYHVDAPARAKTAHESLEEAARSLRYACFRKTMEESGANRLAVAHHSGDAAETVLFQLIRGSSLQGLSGIAPVRGAVIRPMLCLNREEILEDLRTQGFCWRADATNTDTYYARNRIRAEILPELEEIHAGASAHLLRTAQEAGEAADFIHRTAREQLDKAMKKTGEGCVEVSIDAILRQDPVIQKEMVYQCITDAAERKKDIARVHVEAVRELIDRQNGAACSLPYGLCAHRVYDRLVIGPDDACARSVTQTEAALRIPGQTVYAKNWVFTARVFSFDGNYEKIPRKKYTKWLDYDKISCDIQIRGRRTGDIFAVCSDGHKRLKDYLIDRKIPKDRRDGLLLLAAGSEILWIIGDRISEDCKIGPETKRVLEIHIDSDEADE